MKLLQQKRDLSSTTYYILLCFVLLCVFVVVPIILLIYSYHLGSSNLSAASSVLFKYCLAAVIVALLFLISVYVTINKTTKEDFKKTIIDSVRNGLDTQIDDHLEKKAFNKILKDAISNLADGFNCCAKIYEDQGKVIMNVKDNSDKKLIFSLDKSSNSYEITSDNGDYTLDDGLTIKIENKKIKSIKKKK